MTKHITLAASAFAFTTALCGPLAAQQSITINIGSSHPESNIWAYAMKNAFQPTLDRLLEEAGGEYQINWVEAYGGTLYRFNETRTAVRDGIVDIGMVGTVWEGSAMPLQNVTYFTPFATGDHEMLIEIFDELTDTLPELSDSWADQNMVHLSSLITDSYDIYSNFPINSLSDINNRRINAPGTSANWLQGTGTTPLDGALTTYYTDIQTGVSEGALSFATGIQPTRVYEVAPHLTRVGVGAMYFGGIAANMDSFNSWPEAVQEAVREAGRATSRAHGDYVSQRAEVALAEMEGAGLIISDLPDADKQAWVDGLPNIVAPWLEDGGDGAAVVLKAYFDALRSRGVEPLRAWDEGL